MSVTTSTSINQSVARCERCGKPALAGVRLRDSSGRAVALCCLVRPDDRALLKSLIPPDAVAPVEPGGEPVNPPRPEGWKRGRNGNRLNPRPYVNVDEVFEGEAPIPVEGEPRVKLDVAAERKAFDRSIEAASRAAGKPIGSSRRGFVTE